MCELTLLLCAMGPYLCIYELFFPADFPSVPSFLRALRVLRGSFLRRNRCPRPDPAANQLEYVTRKRSCSDVWPMLGRKFVTNKIDVPCGHSGRHSNGFAAGLVRALTRGLTGLLI